LVIFGNFGDGTKETAPLSVISCYPWSETPYLAFRESAEAKIGCEVTIWRDFWPDSAHDRIENIISPCASS